MDMESNDEEDPITVYMHDQENEEEEEDPEVDDLIADLSMFFTDDEEVGPKTDEGNMAKLLKCCVVIPVSSVPCERGFSTQNRIKSAYRLIINTMENHCLAAD